MALLPGLMGSRQDLGGFYIEHIDVDLDQAESEALVTEANTAANLQIPGLQVPLEAGIENKGAWVRCSASPPTFRSLASVLTEQARPWMLQPSLLIVSDLLNLLEQCHRNGFVHGALSPELIEIGPNSEVTLAGLGLRRALVRCRFTAPYRPPEDLLGRECSPASDIYGAGCILATCLFGRAIFERSHPADTRSAVLGQNVPSVRSVHVSASPRLDKLLRELMAPDPADRPPSAKATKLLKRFVGRAERVRGFLGQSMQALSSEAEKPLLSKTYDPEPTEPTAVREDLGWPPYLIRRDLRFASDDITIWAATLDSKPVEVWTGLQPQFEHRVAVAKMMGRHPNLLAILDSTSSYLVCADRPEPGRPKDVVRAAKDLLGLTKHLDERQVYPLRLDMDTVRMTRGGFPIFCDLSGVRVMPRSRQEAVHHSLRELGRLTYTWVTNRDWSQSSPTERKAWAETTSVPNWLRSLAGQPPATPEDVWSYLTES